MLELTGIASVLRGVSVLYWLLVLTGIALALYLPRGARRKALFTAIALAIFAFLPVRDWLHKREHDAYAKAAWAYFKKKCETEAGEKIYKTYSGVRSVLVVKPLPPATEKDLYDQFWYGDPYSASATSERATYAAMRLTMDRKHRTGTGVQRGLDFVEIKNQSGEGYTRIYRPEANDRISEKEEIQKPVSKFGVSWDDISAPEDRRYWVAASRFRVLDLANNSVVAERIGYLIESGFGSTTGQRRPWLAARGIGPSGRSCPDAHDATDLWFITSVFKREKE